MYDVGTHYGILPDSETYRAVDSSNSRRQATYRMAGRVRTEFRFERQRQIYSQPSILGFRIQRSVTHFLALEKGCPVGSATMFVDGSVAGIYNVGTLPDARRRGIGTLMTQWIMKCAREKDCHLAVLTATPLAQSIYHKLGFQNVGKVSFFLWEP